MNLNIDSTIFIGFLALNLFFGLWYSRGIKTIKEYAIGDRNFSTATLAATIVATWITGEVFFTTITETYSNGMYFIFAAAGDVVGLVVIAIFLAPRMGEFLGKLSIAEAMGDLYGQNVRVITALSGCLGTVGIIAVQLKVAGLLFQYCFDISVVYGVIISGIVITLYSSLGGIKSVTFTDVIQFFTFGTIIPSIAFFILGTLDSTSAIINTLSTNELFNYSQVFSFNTPKSQYFLFLFLFFGAVVGINPTIFQRISMAKNTQQISSSFIIAAVSYTFVILAVIWIGVVLLSVHPTLEPSNLVKHILFDYSFVGLKGLSLVGIMAMVMSTADSYINTTSILFVHDFCEPIGIKVTENRLTSSRVISFIVGILALMLSLSNDNLLDIIITTNVFYLPIVVIPFILATLGFRSSGKAVLISMVSGFLVLVVSIILQIDILQGAVLGMAANLFSLFGSHYILRQPGGWVGIKDNTSLNQIRAGRKLKVQLILNSITNFDMIRLLRKNSPRSEGMYAFFGLFCIISIYPTMHTLPREIKLLYPTIIGFIHISVLFISTILISYPLWLAKWKESNFGSMFWNFSVFYILIFASFLLVIMSNFAQLQLVAFMFNLIVIAALVSWQWALFLMTIGLFFAVQFFKSYVDLENLQMEWSLLEFKLTYILLFTGSIMIMFLRPKQEQQALTEEKNEHLNGRIGSQEKQLREALALRSEFIRNVQHEYHAPMTGITGFAQTLDEAYDKLTEEQRKESIKIILSSSRRLDAFDSNISSLSVLSKAGYELTLEQIDFSDLVYDRIEICRKLYEENKEAREFDINIKKNLVFNGDRKYLIQLLDNLVINAITYCVQGKVTIILEQASNQISLTIIDEGIGVPPDELENIFEDFTVSSKTRTPAGNRGVGLALCRRVVEVHGGNIEAESNGEKGAAFIVKLPLYRAAR